MWTIALAIVLAAGLIVVVGAQHREWFFRPRLLQTPMKTLN
jgi:hypothetical protein